jgi:hypothetical protein
VADPNRALFESVLDLLAPVLDELVFVGGCTTGVLVTDPAAAGIRPTKDVDAIVDIATYAEYAALSDRLRAVGLVEDTSDGAPLCRWRKGGLIVDVMPTREDILGFSNRWYALAIETAAHVDIGRHRARVVIPPVFIATKLVAFHSRGRDDVFASHDLEDIVTLVDGRPEIVGEVRHSHETVRTFIAAEISALLSDRDFAEALAGFLLPDAASQARRPILEQRLAALTR